MAGRTAPSAPDTPDERHGADRGAAAGPTGPGTPSRPLVTLALATAASQAPPALLAGALWSTVARHPVAAVALLLGYEAVVALAAFGARVVGDLRDRWARRVAERIDRTARRHVSRFERQYRTEVVLSRNRFVDLKGLATRGDYTPGLEEVFVDVSLVPRPPHQALADPLAGTAEPVGPPAAPPPAQSAVAHTDASGVPARHSIWDFLGRPQGTAVAVVGAPGTGKTTMLQHLALRLARGTGRPPRGGRPRRDLPVLLYLRDHAGTIAERPDIPLAEVIRTSLGRHRADEPPGWFEQQLDRGRCVVLLDGLDEVAVEEERRAVAAWVEQQIASWEQNDFVLTSRPHGYLSAPLNRAQVLQVRRFTGEQISRFVHGWYRAIERLSTGADDRGVAARADEEAADLLRRLRSRPELYELAANPLLLTMIANVHRYRGALPGSRAELYAEICQVLLWRRQEAKHIPVPAAPQSQVSGAKKEIVLRELAFRMMAERTRDVATPRALELLEQALSRVATTVSAEEFLSSVIASGLLVERERGLCAFAHHTLQEHLASLHIQHRGLVRVLQESVDDDWWRETTLLYAARVDPAPVVEACLASRSTTALALAFDCAEEATEFDPDTARRLEALRAATLRAPGLDPLGAEPLWPDEVGSGRDGSLGALMAAVTVTRQLRETIPLGDDALVCVRPVTEEVYRLSPTRSDPDAWLPAAGDGGAGSRTAVGMDRREAAAFVGWLNALMPDGSLWRLPTLEEVTDPAFGLVVRDERHTVWCLPAEEADASLPELWVPPGVRHPWAVTVDPLRVRLERSLAPALTLGRLGVLGHLPQDGPGELTREVAHARAATEAAARRLGLTLTAWDAGLRRALARHLPRALDLARLLAAARDQTSADRTPVAEADDAARRELLRWATWLLVVVQGLAVYGERQVRGASAARLARPLREMVAVDAGTHVIYPDRLSAAVDRVTTLLPGLLPVREPTPLEHGARMLARALRQALPPRGGPPTALATDCFPDGGRIAELAALALAAVADRTLGAPELATDCRTVAWGLRLLRERAEEDVAPSETIVLVRG